MAKVKKSTKAWTMPVRTLHQVDHRKFKYIYLDKRCTKNPKELKSLTEICEACAVGKCQIVPIVNGKKIPAKRKCIKKYT